MLLIQSIFCSQQFMEQILLNVFNTGNEISICSFGYISHSIEEKKDSSFNTMYWINILINLSISW